MNNEIEKGFSEKKIPCNDCFHKNVCSVKKCFDSVKVETVHPYIIVKLECTEFSSFEKIRKVC